MLSSVRTFSLLAVATLAAAQATQLELEYEKVRPPSFSPSSPYSSRHKRNLEDSYEGRRLTCHSNHLHTPFSRTLRDL